MKTQILRSLLADITKVEEQGIKFRKEETSAERVKRQKNEFFVLLTEQLKHQYPMSPMETNEITSQMFAINNVEQQLMTNKHLEDIKEYFSANQNSNYLNYIGKLVDYVGDAVIVEASKGSFDYEILEPVDEAKIEIKNAEGLIIHTTEIDKKVGKNCFIWNKPSHWPDGIYTFAITALKEDDTRVNVRLYGSGRVNGIINQEGGKFFDVNGKLLDISHVVKVKDGAGITSSILSGINDKIDANNNKVGSALNPMSVPIPNFDDSKIMEAIKKQLVDSITN